MYEVKMESNPHVDGEGDCDASGGADLRPKVSQPRLRRLGRGYHLFALLLAEAERAGDAVSEPAVSLAGGLTGLGRGGFSTPLGSGNRPFVAAASGSPRRAARRGVRWSRRLSLVRRARRRSEVCEPLFRSRRQRKEMARLWLWRPDDAVPTRTSVQQREAEDACRPCSRPSSTPTVSSTENRACARPCWSRLSLHARAIPFRLLSLLWHDTRCPLLTPPGCPVCRVRFNREEHAAYLMVASQPCWWLCQPGCFAAMVVLLDTHSLEMLGKRTRVRRACG